ncbi:fimbria/pilus chaperone family protein [Pseudomonas sp. 22526]|uniref:fimbria/pilus chaperone family protein n=1 Tax=Pseudomonas sp. 22526 TaxID=3453937 RepID=UPI003F8740ED
MTIQFKKTLYALLAGSAAALAAPFVSATGMQPETSVVILYEAEGETSINVKNTDGTPALLYSTIENIPEDPESLVVLTPPVTRVEAGETQLVRFLRQGGEPSKTQRLKRVIFEGIAQKPNTKGHATVGVSMRQNLPLIIHPKGLERNREPWKLLKWDIQDGKLMVINDSAYVVRLSQELELKPSGEMALLPRTYVLPGETLKVALDPRATRPSSVTIGPGTVYGFSVDKYEAPIGTTAAR